MTGFPVPKNQRVPRNLWDRTPWNRWSVQHIREILPTAEVWRGTGLPWQLPEDAIDLDGLEFINHLNQSTTTLDWLTDNYADGIAVLHRGTLVYERYFNQMTQRTLHLSQSIAKSVTSAMAGILVERGQLDPEEMIISYLPELKETAWNGAALRHALDMTSGVRYIEDYEALNPDIAANDIASGWRTPQQGIPTYACIWDQIMSLKQTTRPHGERFKYRSIETDVLAHCMERVTRTRLAQLISHELWQPLGTEESACFTVDRIGYPLADGGFNATLRDYARFGQMLCNKGVANGKQIVPVEWLNDTLAGNPSQFGEPYSDTFKNGAYRNQFWIRDVGRRIIMALGVFGQLIYVDIDNELVITRLASWPEFLSLERKLDDLAAIDAITKQLKG